MSHALDRPLTHRRAREEELTPAMFGKLRARLLAMKADIVHRIHHEPPPVPRAARAGDLADQANADLDFEQEVEERRREHHELAEIEHALARMDNGTYGVCAATGEPIGLRRLLANPTATLSVAAQERREQVGGR